MTQTATVETVQKMLQQVLGLGDRAAELGPDTRLLGNLPELDSMAVVEIVGDIETRFGITVHDEDITAETFATMGSLIDFIAARS